MLKQLLDYIQTKKFENIAQTVSLTAAALYVTYFYLTKDKTKDLEQIAKELIDQHAKLAGYNKAYYKYLEKLIMMYEIDDSYCKDQEAFDKLENSLNKMFKERDSNIIQALTDKSKLIGLKDEHIDRIKGAVFYSSISKYNLSAKEYETLEMKYKYLKNIGPCEEIKSFRTLNYFLYI